MSNFHKLKEKERENKKLVFNEKSLNEWKQNQLNAIRKKVADDLKAELEKDLRKNLEVIEAKKQEIKQEAIDEAFILMIGIPIRAMKEKYGWGRNKRLPELAETICQYYADFANGTEGIKEYQRIVWEEAGIGFAKVDEDDSKEKIVEEYEKHLKDV